MFNRDTSIFEWMPNEGEHNFGDHLIQLLGERLFDIDEWARIQASRDLSYVLLGSFICNHNMVHALEDRKKLVLIGTGYRNEPLAEELLGKVHFVGSRGFHTFKALLEYGIDAKPIGDPAMVLPLIVGRGRQLTQQSIFMPHIGDTNRLNYTPNDVGCDTIIQPTTRTTADLVRIIQAISTSRFVLAGAMHAAIVAHAYGVPFAFFRKGDGYLDCPPKWADWLSSISDPYVSPEFFDNARDGYAWWLTQRQYLFRNRYIPFVRAFAAIGRVRTGVKRKAVLLDRTGVDRGKRLAPFGKLHWVEFNPPVSAFDSHAQQGVVHNEPSSALPQSAVALSIPLTDSLEELASLVQNTLTRRDHKIAEMREQLKRSQEHFVRAEAQLDFLKEILVADLQKRGE